MRILCILPLISVESDREYVIMAMPSAGLSVVMTMLHAILFGEPLVTLG